MVAMFGRPVARWAAAAAIAAAALPALAQIRPPAGAPPPAPAVRGQQFDDWRKQCDPARDGRPEQCFIFQKLVVKESGKNLMAIQIAYVGEPKTPAAILIVPLGIFIPAGITFTVPGAEPLRIPVDVCTQQGCRGGTKLSDEILAAMRKASQAKVTLHNVKPRREVNLPVSLKGFSKGFAALKPN